MSTTTNIDQLTSLVNSLQNQIDQINSGNIAGTNILSISQKLDNLNDLTIPSLRDNINNIQNSQDNLQQSHTNFQNRLDNNNNSLSDLQNQIQDTSTNHNTLANNLNNLNNQHNDLNNKQLNTINNTQNLQNSVNNLNNSHSSISNEIQNLKYQMQSFNTKLETITPTDSQHSQLMSKIDNLSNTLTPVMVRTQIAQQASNNLYAQLQPLQQTVNSQTAQIQANSSGILQNASQAASNFGAFYGMGGEPELVSDNTSQQNNDNNDNNDNDNDGGDGGGDDDGAAPPSSSPGLINDFEFRRAWYDNLPNLMQKSEDPEDLFGLGQTTLVSSQKGMKGIASKLRGPNNITDLSWLGINVDKDQLKDNPSASSCIDLFKKGIPLWTYSSSNSPPPKWINYCTSVKDEAEKKTFHLIPTNSKGFTVSQLEATMAQIPCFRKFSDSETYYAFDPYLFYALMSTWGTGIDDKRLLQPTQKGLINKYISAYGTLGYSLPRKGGNIAAWSTGDIGISSPLGWAYPYFINEYFQKGKLGDFSDWDTSNVTTMRGMFFGSGLYSNFWGQKGLEWDTSKVTDMSGMFMLNCAWRPKTSITNYGPSGGLKGQMSTYMDVSGSHKGKHNDLNIIMGTYDASVLGSSYNEPSKGAATDLDLWNVNNVKDMSFMFFGTWWLDPPYDSSNPKNGMGGGMVLDKWNTSNVTDMSYLFANTGWGLSKGITTWDTTKVNNMEGLFFGNTSIAYRYHYVELDWDTSQVTNMSKMFSGGYNRKLYSGLYIRSVRSGENFKYADVLKTTTTPAKVDGFMIPPANFLRDLSFGSKWKTDNVLEMNSMFAFAIYLNAQDSTDGPAPPNMGSMKGWIVNKVTSGYEMFLNSIIGDTANSVMNYTTNPNKKLDLSSWSFPTGADVRGFINPYSGMILQNNSDTRLQYGVGASNQFSSKFDSNGKFKDWNTFQSITGYGALRLQWDNYYSYNENTPSNTYSQGIGKRCPKIGGDSYSLCGICRRQVAGNPPYLIQNTGSNIGMYRGGSITFTREGTYYIPGTFSGDYEYLENAWQTYWNNNDLGSNTAMTITSYGDTGVNLRAGVDKKGTNLCPQRGPMLPPNGNAILS